MNRLRLIVSAAVATLVLSVAGCSTKSDNTVAAPQHSATSPSSLTPSAPQTSAPTHLGRVCTVLPASTLSAVLNQPDQLSAVDLVVLNDYATDTSCGYGIAGGAPSFELEVFTSGPKVDVNETYSHNRADSQKVVSLNIKDVEGFTSTDQWGTKIEFKLTKGGTPYLIRFTAILHDQLPDGATSKIVQIMQANL